MSYSLLSSPLLSFLPHTSSPPSLFLDLSWDGPAGFNPMWEETLVFTVHLPELALVRFLVWDHDPIGQDFIGQRTLAFNSMMTGKTEHLLVDGSESCPAPPLHLLNRLCLYGHSGRITSVYIDCKHCSDPKSIGISPTLSKNATTSNHIVIVCV